MEWTVGTFWTTRKDSRRLGLIGDRLDSGDQLAQRWGEDSRLMRHGPMDWTVGTFWTSGNDS